MATEGQILNYLIAYCIGMKTGRTAENVLKEARSYYNNDEEREEKTEGFSWNKELKKEGVSISDIRDFLKIRKEKHLTNTKKSWDEMKVEAERVKMTIPQVVDLALRRGWGYFRAEWITNKEGQPQQTDLKWQE